MAFTPADLPPHAPLDPESVALYRTLLADVSPSLRTLGAQGDAFITAVPGTDTHGMRIHTHFSPDAAASAHDRLTRQAALAASGTLEDFARTGTALGAHLHHRFGTALSRRDTLHWGQAWGKPLLTARLVECYFNVPDTEEGIDTLALIMAYAQRVIVQDRDAHTIPRGDLRLIRAVDGASYTIQAPGHGRADRGRIFQALQDAAKRLATHHAFAYRLYQVSA